MSTGPNLLSLSLSGIPRPVNQNLATLIRELNRMSQVQSPETSPRPLQDAVSTNRPASPSAGTTHHVRRESQDALVLATRPLGVIQEIWVIVQKVSQVTS